MAFCGRTACCGAACHLMWAVLDLTNCFVQFECLEQVCMLESKLPHPKHMLVHAQETKLQ